MNKYIKINTCSECQYLSHSGGMSTCLKIAMQIPDGGDYRKAMLPQEDDEGVHPNCPL